LKCAHCIQEYLEPEVAEKTEEELIAERKKRRQVRKHGTARAPIA
jgi:hypothetical protein